MSVQRRESRRTARRRVVEDGWQEVTATRGVRERVARNIASRNIERRQLNAVHRIATVGFERVVVLGGQRIVASRLSRAALSIAGISIDKELDLHRQRSLCPKTCHSIQPKPRQHGLCLADFGDHREIGVCPGWC